MPSPLSPGAVADAPARRRAWWGDRPVAVKVLTAVGAASAVAAVIGVTGLQALASEAEASQRMYQEDVRGIDGIAALIGDVQAVAVAQRDAVLARTPDATAAALQEGVDARAAFDADLAGYLALAHPAETEEVL